MWQIIALKESTRFCNSCEKPAKLRLVSCTTSRSEGEMDNERPIAVGLDVCRPCGRMIGRSLAVRSAEPRRPKKAKPRAKKKNGRRRR